MHVLQDATQCEANPAELLLLVGKFVPQEEFLSLSILCHELHDRFHSLRFPGPSPLFKTCFAANAWVASFPVLRMINAMNPVPSMTNYPTPEKQLLITSAVSCKRSADGGQRALSAMQVTPPAWLERHFGETRAVELYRDACGEAEISIIKNYLFSARVVLTMATAPVDTLLPTFEAWKESPVVRQGLLDACTRYRNVIRVNWGDDGVRQLDDLCELYEQAVNAFTKLSNIVNAIPHPMHAEFRAAFPPELIVRNTLVPTSFFRIGVSTSLRKLHIRASVIVDAQLLDTRDLPKTLEVLELVEMAVCMRPEFADHSLQELLLSYPYGTPEQAKYGRGGRTFIDLARSPLPRGLVRLHLAGLGLTDSDRSRRDFDQLQTLHLDSVTATMVVAIGVSALRLLRARTCSAIASGSLQLVGLDRLEQFFVGPGVFVLHTTPQFWQPFRSLKTLALLNTCIEMLPMDKLKKIESVTDLTLVINAPYDFGNNSQLLDLFPNLQQVQYYCVGARSHPMERKGIKKKILSRPFPPVFHTSVSNAFSAFNASL